MKKNISKPTGEFYDKTFLKEIIKRNAEMGTGTVQTYTWEEVQQRAKLSLAKARAARK